MNTPGSASSPLPDRADCIPLDLKDRPQWALWRHVRRGGDRAKVPFQPDGRPAKSNDPATWCSFDTAWQAYCRGGWAGLVFAFADDDGLVGVDLDGCISPNGKMASWAYEVVCRLGSYAEISPSGTGVKIFTKSRKPPRGTKVDLPGENLPGLKTAAIEIYGRGRFFAITGHVFLDRPVCEADLEWIFAKYPFGLEQRHFGPRGITAQPPILCGQLLEGGRNVGLFRYACRLRALGMPDERIAETVHYVNACFCNPPLNAVELNAILKSALKYPSGKRKGSLWTLRAHGKTDCIKF